MGAKRTVAAIGACLLACAVVAVGAPGRVVVWYATTKTNLDRPAMVGDKSYTLSLSNGWECGISETKPYSEARLVKCAKGEEAFEFTVSCEPNRPEDHTQIRFLDPEGKTLDLIEVLCKTTFPGER